MGGSEKVTGRRQFNLNEQILHKHVKKRENKDFRWCTDFCTDLWVFNFSKHGFLPLSSGNTGSNISVLNSLSDDRGKLIDSRLTLARFGPPNSKCPYRAQKRNLINYKTLFIFFLKKYTKIRSHLQSKKIMRGSELIIYNFIYKLSAFNIPKRESLIRETEKLRPESSKRLSDEVAGPTGDLSHSEKRILLQNLSRPTTIKYFN